MQGLIDELRSVAQLTEASATSKQITYAWNLTKQVGDEWLAMAKGFGLGPSPSRDDIKALDKKDVSKIIKDLKAAKKATPKQIGYALSLMMQFGGARWKKTAFNHTYGRPTAANLRKMPLTKMSKLINDLKYAIQNDPYH
jgi:hypothetical protein